MVPRPAGAPVGRVTDGYRRFYLTTARVNNVHRRSQASHLVNSARRAGVLISATGPGANVLKIRPPLVFKKEHAEILVDTLTNVLSA